MMKAEIVAVGTELLLGQIANTNAQFLSQKLAEMGIGVYYHLVVGDNFERLCGVIKEAASRSDLVIFTGGLGPTQDDLTKEAVAACVGQPLRIDEQAMQRIQDHFERRGLTMTENNRKQALVLEGSRVFPNDYGMAPGFGYHDGKTTYILLPGPPSELYPMVNQYVMPYLAELHGRNVFHSRVLRFFGIGESALEAALEDLIEQQSNPTIAPYAGDYEASIRLTAAAESIEAAEQLIAPIEQEIRKRVGQHIYGTGTALLHEVLVQELVSRQESLACAESCTGGQISALLTSVPGSSAVFPGGIVSYSDEVKRTQLDVPAEVIRVHGAVSQQTAIVMAENIRVKMKATHGLAVTGVAGPAESEGKPVGLVYVGIASEGMPTAVHELRLVGQRKTISGRAAKTALFYMLQRLKER